MESPVIIENCTQFGQSVDPNKTDFPFDDSDDPIQSRLNNLFGDFSNFRRNRRRQGAGSSGIADDRFGTSNFGPLPRFTDRPFTSGFNRFPFSQHFDDDFVGYPASEEKPPEFPTSSEKRTKKANPYLPQHLSNTVDLGQKQPPVESVRSQRSMSAPPENRQSANNRFENEPPKQQYEEGHQHNMGKNFSRQQPSQPKERIIPIHVEGRDDPVMPKNPNFQPSTNAEKVFGGEKVQTGGFPSQYSHQRHPEQNPYKKQMYDQFMPQAPPNKQSSGFSRQQTPPASHHQQHPHHHDQQQQYYTQASPQPQHQQRTQTTPPPQSVSNDPLDKIKSVRSDVMELMTQVEKFQGTRKDKEYLYLDEMLTRNLLKLDNIDTDGKDNIRLARKEAIKCIQTCINNLEAKAQAKEKELKSSETSEQKAMNVSEEPQKQIQSTDSNDPPTFTSEATLIMFSPKTTTQQEQKPEESTENMNFEHTSAHPASDLNASLSESAPGTETVFSATSEQIPNSDQQSLQAKSQINESSQTVGMDIEHK